MVRGHFDRSDILVVLEKLHLLAGRDMQHMHAPAGLARQPHQPLRRRECGELVAPDRMRARIAFDAQILALVEPGFVFGMERGAAPDGLEDVAHALVVGDQQRPSRGAHEYLDSGRAGQALQLAEIPGILPRGADEEGKIAMHAMMGAQAFAVVVHDRAAPEDEVVALAHDGSSWPPRGAGMMSRPPSRGPS
jgi:hypothetical protein